MITHKNYDSILDYNTKKFYGLVFRKKHEPEIYEYEISDFLIANDLKIVVNSKEEFLGISINGKFANIETIANKDRFNKFAATHSIFFKAKSIQDSEFLLHLIQVHKNEYSKIYMHEFNGIHVQRNKFSLIQNNKLYRVDNQGKIETKNVMCDSKVEINVDLEKEFPFKLETINEVLKIPHAIFILSWAIALPYKNIVDKNFPILSFFAPTETGKNELIQHTVIPIVYGNVNGNVFNRPSVASLRTHLNKTNLFICADEINYQTFSKSERVGYNEIFKCSFGGLPMSKMASNNIDTIETPINGSVCIIGEEKPDEEALDNRSVVVSMTRQQKLSPSAWDKVANDYKTWLHINQQNYKLLLQSNKADIQNKFRNHYKEIKKIKSLKSREKDNMTYMLFGLDLLCEIAGLDFEEQSANMLEMIQGSQATIYKIIDKILLFNNSGSQLIESPHVRILDKKEVICFKHKSVLEKLRNFGMIDKYSNDTVNTMFSNEEGLLVTKEKTVTFDDGTTLSNYTILSVEVINDNLKDVDWEKLRKLTNTINELQEV